jgi:hypothetical protein
LCVAARDAGKECLAAALEYLKNGWSITTPCPPDHACVGKTHAKHCSSPGKAPWGEWKERQEKPPTEAELRKKCRDNPFLNVGMALGPASGLVRIDIDGADGEAFFKSVCGEIPPTLEFDSGGGGRGLLFAIDDTYQIRTTTKIGEGVHSEVRFQAKGAQTVLPPSRLPSGRRYAWKVGRGPGEIEVAKLPPALVSRVDARNADVERCNGPFILWIPPACDQRTRSAHGARSVSERAT